MDQFGSRVRARRRALNIPMRQIAKAIGRAISHISYIECGHIAGSRSDRERIDAFLRERELVSGTSIPRPQGHAAE